MNQEIRQAIKAAGLKQWQVAKAIGVSEYSFIRWLRDELPEERRKIVYRAIEELSRKEA